jgi:Class III cytochrome C family
MQWLFRYGSLLALSLIGAAGIVVAFQPTDAAWWSVRMPGLMALLLAAAAIASRPFPRNPAWHRLLGWLAAVALVAHVLLAAGLEPTLWRWLSPAMPVEIVLGLLAAAALFTTLAVGRSQRLRLRRGTLTALGPHRIAGIVACVAAGTHIALIAGTETAVALLISSAIILLLAVVFRSGNHPRAAVVALVPVMVAVTALTVGPLSELRLASLRISPIDHARFSHSDHDGVICTTCHHNFVGHRGDENCIICHKQLTRMEALRVDRLFHAFCSDCHKSEKRAGHRTGPIDHCGGCHAN